MLITEGRRCDLGAPSGQSARGPLLPGLAEVGGQGLRGGLGPRLCAPADHSALPVPRVRRGAGWEGMAEAPGPGGGKGPELRDGRRLGLSERRRRGLSGPGRARALGPACATHSVAPLPRPSPPLPLAHLHMIRHFAPFMLLSGPPSPPARTSAGAAAAAAAAVAAAPARWRLGALRSWRSAARLRRPGPAGPGWRMRSAAGTA